MYIHICGCFGRHAWIYLFDMMHSYIRHYLLIHVCVCIFLRHTVSRTFGLTHLHSHVWNDSLIHTTSPICTPLCVHFHMSHGSFILVKMLIYTPLCLSLCLPNTQYERMFGRTHMHSHLWHDSFIHARMLIHTPLCVSLSSTQYERICLTCVHSRMWHDSFIHTYITHIYIHYYTYIHTSLWACLSL